MLADDLLISQGEGNIEQREEEDREERRVKEIGVV